jgi:hypothetical protein
MRMRYLSGNKGTTLPSEVCYLGVAGRRTKIKGDARHEHLHFDSLVARFARLEAVGSTRRSEIYSRDPAKFWTYLDGRLNRSRPVWVFVYDCAAAASLVGLWSRLNSGLYDRGTIIDTDPPTVIKLHSVSGNVCFIDVKNYYNLTIDELAASFDVVVNWHKWLDEVKDDDYQEATYRCIVAERSISALMSSVRQHDLGRFKTTISLQAMQAFRHRFAPRVQRVAFAADSSNPCQPKEVIKCFPLSHDDRKIHAFERSANFSGHNECFFIGHIIEPGGFFSGEEDFRLRRNGSWLYGPIHHVDVNSLYPYVMRRFFYPKRLVGHNDKATVLHLRELTEKYGVIARVLVETEHDTFPVHHGDRIIYATGMYWTTLCGDELMFALGQGYVTKVGFHACYQMMDLFSAYVDYFYSLKLRYREECNHAMTLIAKMFLNTLQGKFCQRSKRWVERQHVKAEHQYGRWYHVDYDAVLANETLDKIQTTVQHPAMPRKKEVYRYRAIAGKTQELIEDDEINYSVPAIGAFVTSNARQYMSDIRKIVGQRNVLYQGTDSLLLLPPGMKELEDGSNLSETELGLFRVKGKYNSAAIMDVQDYKLGCDRVTKGIPKDAIVASDHEYIFSQRQGLEGMLHTQPAEQITYTTVRRTMAHAYSGGVVGKDGWVTPFHLNLARGQGDAWEGC